MWLIDSITFELKFFLADRPAYAILSHTWGSDEVAFQDFKDLSIAKDKAGFNKIKLTCAQALKDGFEYAWVDTCCINKESSSELSEAINSMFEWYEHAAICYAYIEDIMEEVALPILVASVLEDCRWFSRGWTLQELLAPKYVVFYGLKWNRIGTKENLHEVLAKVTGIPSDVLTKSKLLSEVSVADRMSWAAKRNTARVEDIAYSLMGMFDVNMPMMYGEGKKAFIRLQEEILKQTQDDSLFAWRASEQSESEHPYRGLFASSPTEFAGSISITPFKTQLAGMTNIMSNGHISLNCVVYDDYKHNKETSVFIGLKCFLDTDMSKVGCIEVVRIGGNAFLRSSPSVLYMQGHSMDPRFETVMIERYTEKSKVPIMDDIYKENAVHLRKIPPSISINSKTAFSFRLKPDIFPLVSLLGAKLRVKLSIDKSAVPPYNTVGYPIPQIDSRIDTGIDTLKEIGWYTEDIPPSGSERCVHLLIWAEPIEGSGSYQHYYEIEGDFGKLELPEPYLTSKIEEADYQLPIDSNSTVVEPDYQLTIGWNILKFTGNYGTVDGYTMFCIDMDYTENYELKMAAFNEIREQRKSREQKRREQESREIERRRIRDSEEWEELVYSEGHKGCDEEHRSWLAYSIPIILLSVFVSICQSFPQKAT